MYALQGLSQYINSSEFQTAYIFYIILTMDHFVLSTFLFEIISQLVLERRKYCRKISFWVTLISVLSIAYMASLLMYNGLRSVYIQNIWSLKSQKPVILMCQSARLLLCTRYLGFL